MIIRSIEFYRVRNNKIEKKHINIRFFDFKDLKYILLYDKTIQGILINKP